MPHGGVRPLLARPDAARRSLTPIRVPERYGALLASCRAPESRRTIPTSRPPKMPPGAAVGLFARQMRGAVHGLADASERDAKRSRNPARKSR